VHGGEEPDPGAGSHRTDPAPGPASPERATHNYVRHGTTTLSAALEVATGKLTDACYERHRHEEFLDFLKKVVPAPPRVASCTSSWTTTGPTSTPTSRPRLESTPDHAALHADVWLVAEAEVFFSIIIRQAVRRGTFKSVRDLVGAIHRFIDAWNDRCHPFVWTKTPDEVLRRVRNRQTTSDAGQ